MASSSSKRRRSPKPIEGSGTPSGGGSGHRLGAAVHLRDDQAAAQAVGHDVVTGEGGVAVDVVPVVVRVDHDDAPPGGKPRRAARHGRHGLWRIERVEHEDAVASHDDAAGHGEPARDDAVEPDGVGELFHARLSLRQVGVANLSAARPADLQNDDLLGSAREALDAVAR